MKYVFDTSAFIVLKNYYPTTFATLWDRIGTLAGNGTIVSVREVFNELHNYNEVDFIQDWAKQHKTIFGKPTNDELLVVQQILAIPHFQTLIENKAILKGTPVADPFVIAAAKVTGGTVVTQEKFKPNADREKVLAKASETIDDQVAEKLKLERDRISAEEAKKAKLAAASDLEQRAKEIVDLQEVLKSREEKLAEAQNAQADLIKKQRELDDAKRELELTVQKRIQEGLAATRQEAKKEAEDELNLKVKEKDQTIISMQQKIEVLKRQAEQGSQQLQGDITTRRRRKAKFCLGKISLGPRNLSDL